MPAFKYSVSFLLSDKTSKKESPIRCFVRYNKKQVAVSTGLAILPEKWDGGKQKAKVERAAGSSTEWRTINNNLLEIQKWVDLAFDELTKVSREYPSVQDFKNLYEHLFIHNGAMPGETKKSQPTGLFQFAEQLIKDTREGRRLLRDGTRYSKETIKTFNNSCNVLKRFAAFKGRREYKFDEVDLDFYHELRDFLYVHENRSDNYFGTVVKNLKVLLNEAAEAGLHTSNKHKSKRFSKVQSTPDNVYLSVDHLDKLAKHDFSNNKRLERVRDLFLVGCWTGLRFSDFNNIKTGNISDNYIDIKTQKTGQMVAVPIHDNLRSIMERYRGTTDNSLPPSISIVKMNLYIKEVCKEAKLDDTVSLTKAKAGRDVIINKPLYELVTTHTARRSFASNMFKMGVPTMVIMAITGHKTQKAFESYIKLTSKEKADIMREIWNRQSMKVVEK